MFKNNKTTMLWLVKLMVTLFSVPDTGYAFYYDVFSKMDRPFALNIFTTILAVLTVDIVFLWVLGVLEDIAMHPLDRLPYVLGAILFAIFNIWIGIRTENSILAFVPRIGLLMVVFIYVNSFAVSWVSFWFSREQVEKRLRDAEVKIRRTVEKETYAEVLESNRPFFKERHKKRLMEQLKIEEQTPERSELVIPEKDEGKIVELPEYVEITSDGYGWRKPDGELVETNSKDEPYTLRGAQIAASRFMKANSNGTH